MTVESRERETRETSASDPFEPRRPPPTRYAVVQGWSIARLADQLVRTTVSDQRDTACAGGPLTLTGDGQLTSRDEQRLVFGTDRTGIDKGTG